MALRYLVVPFIGQIKARHSAAEVSSQLQALIDQYSSQGWDLHLISDVNIEVKPGCLGALLGERMTYIRFDQVIFRRPA